MKLLATIVAASFFLVACDQKFVEEFSFKTTLKYQMNNMCGEDKECVATVESQLQACLDKTDWRALIKSKDDDAQMDAFRNAFFPCFRKADGSPYFQVKNS